MAYITSTYSTLKQAIANRQPVACWYRGHYRECCPHVIGTKRGEAQVLMFQFGGTSNSRLPPGGEWRCMVVGEISRVAIIEGPWRSGTSHLRPQTCVDCISAEVAHS